MNVTVDDVTSRAVSNAAACLPDHMTSRHVPACSLFKTRSVVSSLRSVLRWLCLATPPRLSHSPN